MNVGALIFPQIDQMDFIGPVEVLGRLPETNVVTIARNLAPVRDFFGLSLIPTLTMETAPAALDVLVVPGGPGQLALMDDEKALAWLRAQAANARYILSVCTGALTLGAAGLLRGRRVTTHWNSFHLLPYFGAIPEDARVVVDGNLVSSAGVSAGIDGSLRLAAMLCGDDVAKRVQLEIHYAPEPPFAAGSPEQVPKPILLAAQHRFATVTDKRLDAAKRYAAAYGSAAGAFTTVAPH